MNANGFATGIISVLTAIVGVAIIAVLVSSKSQTSSVITSAGKAFSGIVGAAVNPVSANII